MRMRARLALAAAAVLAATGLSSAATPLRLDYCVEALGGGVYQYTFTLTLDNNNNGWVAGQGWGWLIFGDGRRVSPLTGIVMTSTFPIGPWTSLGSSGGGHNGPTFQPVTGAFWVPTAVGESLTWQCTSTSFLEEGQVAFATLQSQAGAQAANFDVAHRVTCGVSQGACCRPDGSCIIVSSASCTNEGGVFQGKGTTCGTVVCAQPPTGACCRLSGCSLISQADCTGSGGVYQGDGTACATAGCAPAGAFSLTPPDFTALSRVWTFNPSYSQVLSGGAFRATGFRLSGFAERAYEAFQSDLLMELVPPSGPSLLIGGDGGSPFVANSMRWATIRLSGTGPAASNNAGTFDGTYSWDFGNVDGTWTVNFWNNWGPLPTNSAIGWNNVVVELLNAGAGACCLPDGTCIDTARGNCLVQNGIYQGDGAPCGTSNCRPYVFTTPSNASTAVTAGNGIFLNLTGGRDLEVDRFDYAAVSAAGSPTTVEVWKYPGSYIGHDADQTGWVLHESVNGVSGGTGALVPLNLTNPLTLPAGEPMGVYLVAQSGGLRFLSTGLTSFGTTDLQILSERRRSLPWAGTLSTNSSFAGRAFFDPTCLSGTCDFALLTPMAPNVAVTTAASGIFFDLNATPEISINRLDYFSGATTGTAVTADVYTKTGTYVGFDTNAGAWTLVGTFTGVSGGAESAVVLDFASHVPPIDPIVMAAGEVRAFYIVGTGGGYRYRTTTPSQVNDGRVTLDSNVTRSALFGGTQNTARRFVGRVHYTSGGPAPCYADCDHSNSLNVNDFICFQAEFAAATPYADCDQGGTHNVNDFICFQSSFAAGCP